MSKQELNHALRYAREATKEFLMQRYQTLYPHIFQHAVLEKRPATNQDYFIPPSLKNQSFVVTRTHFLEMGCLQLSCFPIKRNLELCNDQDKPHFEQIGQQFYLVCQPICKNLVTPVDTEWVRGKCVLANPLKKMLAMFPEQLFERNSPHVFHGGLELNEGHLKLNETYCEAYGLDFIKDDCSMTTGQSVGEWFLGKTPYRAIKTANLKPWQKNPPPLPNYVMSHLNRKRRRTPTGGDKTEKKVFEEIVRDLSADYGIDVSLTGLELFLKKKAPALLTKAVNSLPIRVALKEAVQNAVVPIGIKSFVRLGSAVTIVGAIYTLYDLLSSVLDVFDPFDYNRVLDKKTIDLQNKILDNSYYQSGEIRPELTPEYIWNHNILTDDDESEVYEFMAERVDEYLKALRMVPEKEKMAALTQFDKTLLVGKPVDRWVKSIHVSVILMLVCLVVLFWDWVHIWTMLFFFVMLYSHY